MNMEIFIYEYIVIKILFYYILCDTGSEIKQLSLARLKVLSMM